MRWIVKVWGKHVSFKTYEGKVTVEMRPSGPGNGEIRRNSTADT